MRTCAGCKTPAKCKKAGTCMGKVKSKAKPKAKRKAPKRGY